MKEYDVYLYQKGSRWSELLEEGWKGEATSDAAEEIVEDYDTRYSDLSVLRGHGYYVVFVEPTTGEKIKFSIYAEAEPVYTAYPLKDDEDTSGGE